MPRPAVSSIERKSGRTSEQTVSGYPERVRGKTMRQAPDRIGRLGGQALAALLVAAAMVLAASGTAAAAPLPVGNFASGLATEFTNPGGNPPGSDIWSCRPSAAHPYPVILVHGTLANENFSWQALSPMLANAGYCVYTFNYGANGSTFGHLYGLADIPQSAQQLSAFVKTVLTSTGASQVDMVGHSQGGMMPRYYIQFLGGAASVHLLVGLAPSNQGTTVDGLGTLASLFGSIGLPVLTLAGCVSCTEQLMGSAFLQQLNAGGGISSTVRYVVVETRYDEVVTPYTNAFLPSAPNVRNVVLQDQCPTDFTEHLGIIYDPVALQDVMNALGRDKPAFRPSCSIVLPVVG
jgi:triacylglycerol esterase/lipase EstA (alpha/beta hydrolase family)